ncbi:LolA family protein [Rodentibacter caecimuris]|uniref:Outer membrane lipoprotein carrier protein LolA n=1 Tax=Rodentibacter caecimuris TaxID=1796644 RepID=A0ABX3L049_9PAST|nr:hypothetical protein BKG89_00540 [Rodentibacter heylii]
MFRVFILFIGLCFSLFSFAFSQQDLVTQLQQPQNVQGEFIQQRFLKSLIKPIQTNGQFTLVKHQGLLWQMKEPFSADLRVQKNGISQWNSNHWVTTDKLGQSQQISLFLGLLSGDMSALESQFNLMLSGNSKDWQLTLTPDSLLMKQIFEQIQIRGDAVVKSIELREKQGDRTLILLQNILLNQPLTPFAQSALY